MEVLSISWSFVYFSEVDLPNSWIRHWQNCIVFYLSRLCFGMTCSGLWFSYFSHICCYFRGICRFFRILRQSHWRLFFVKSLIGWFVNLDIESKLRQRCQSRKIIEHIIGWARSSDSLLTHRWKSIKFGTLNHATIVIVLKLLHWWWHLVTHLAKSEIKRFSWLGNELLFDSLSWT